LQKANTEDHGHEQGLPSTELVCCADFGPAVFHDPISSTELLCCADFGLAVFYDPNQLPRTDLGLEGTPWFLAPENLSSEFYPASDLWSAGVMAYQLLSGYLPFDDRRNRTSPALSQVHTTPDHTTCSCLSARWPLALIVAASLLYFGSADTTAYP
jgi:serine/threonine protein kinase